MKKSKLTIVSLLLAAALCCSLALPAAANDFADEDDMSANFKADLFKLYSLNIIDGYNSNGKIFFDPNGSMTRESVAKVLAYIRLGANISNISDYYDEVKCPFSDIEYSWARDSIAWCYAQGIVSGDGTGKYDPSAHLSYAQAIKLLLSADGYNFNSRYTGASWAKNALADAKEANMFSAFPNNNLLDPDTLTVPNQNGVAVSADSDCPRQCFCALACYIIFNIAQKSSDTPISQSVYNIAGTVTAQCASVNAVTAVATYEGTLSQTVVSLNIAADGSSTATETVKAAPISIAVSAASNTAVGTCCSFDLQTASASELAAVSSSFTTVSQSTDLTKSAESVAASTLIAAPVSVQTYDGALSTTISAGQAATSLLDITRATVLAATSDYLVFNDTVTLVEAGTHVKTLSAAEAKAYCTAHPGITAVSMHGIVISLENSDSTAKKFPNTVLYFGDSATCVDSNNEPYWQIKVYGEGQFRTVNIKKLITASGSSTKLTTTEATTRNYIDVALNNAACKLTSTTGANQSIYVLHLASDLDGNLVAYSYGSGSKNAAKTYIVSACNDENVRMTQTEYGKTGETIDGIIAKSGDHAFGGCYDLTSPKGIFAAKDLTLGDTVIAFFDTADGNNYPRAAYVISAAAQPETNTPPTYTGPVDVGGDTADGGATDSGTPVAQ